MKNPLSLVAAYLAQLTDAVVSGINQNQRVIICGNIYPIGMTVILHLIHDTHHSPSGGGTAQSGPTSRATCR
jgi:hypothetical protein